MVSFLLHDSDSELSDSECEPCEDPGLDDSDSESSKIRMASFLLHDSDSESCDSECEPCEEDPDAFPDHWHWKTKSDKMVQVLTSRVDADGGLWGGCDNTCKHKDVDMAMFAPSESTKTNGARQNFFAALDAFAQAFQAEDWAEATKQRAIVERLRTKVCHVCCESMKKLTPEQQACKDEWDRMRKAACRKNNGCCNQECTERGMAAWIAISADHGTNPKRYNLSDYLWWARNGGVLAMREEEEKRIHQWPCMCCHMLEPTSKTGKINNPRTMERKPDETEKKFQNRQYMAAITFPKYCYVNTLKQAIGACQYPGCGRKVVEGNEASFHFDHLVENTKRKCRCLNDEGLAQGPCHGCADREFGRSGGVAGLAGKPTQATSLEKDADGNPMGRIKELLDTEAAPKTCDLLCSNCHVCRKARKIARQEEFVRPAPPPRRQLLMDDRSVKRRAYMAARAAKRKRDAEA